MTTRFPLSTLASKLSAITLLSALSAGAYAAPFNYDEAVDGDIESPGYYYEPGAFTLTADAGANVVTFRMNGTQYGQLGCTEADCTDIDDYVNIVIPHNLRIDSVTVDYQLTRDPAYTDPFVFNYSHLVLRVDNPGSMGVTTVAESWSQFGDTQTGNLGLDIINGSNVGEGLFILDHGWVISGAGPWILDQTVTFNVSQVPLPTAAWLFGSGLLGLIATRRGKKA